jgi:tRNA modification GTPase
LNPADTIAAVATPPGEGGLAIIRISGPDAVAVAGRCFRPLGRCGLADSPPRTAVTGRVERDGRTLDEAVATVFRGPRSFTAEDTVEVACHGGVLVTRLVLGAVLASGARPAEPGEFTLRAFLNGRLDLAQAEAVADLIHARTERALDAAREQLAGALSSRIAPLRDDLLAALAHVEAHIDFPDEDISPDATDALLARMDSALGRIDALLRTAREGRILRHGLRTAIIGRPNAGKSSLLNRLLGRDRAIVSGTPGTTRDTIEETANIRGIPVVLVDTAGLRESADPVEGEGIRRSLEAARTAELVLHVYDAAEPGASLDPCPVPVRRILVANKCDLPHPATPDDAVRVSCADGSGLAELSEAIEREAGSGAAAPAADRIAIGARHQLALERAREGVARAREGLREGVAPELVAFELRVAVSAVGEVVGGTSTEDLLDAIFGTFCLGK